MKKIKIKKGLPYPLGAFLRDDGINFSMVNDSKEESGIILYKKGLEQKRIPFDKKYQIGNISCIFIEGISSDYEYNFYIGNQTIVDPYAKRIIGNEKWRSGELKKPVLRGGFYNSDYEWMDSESLCIPYNESIMYCLHVRGFTRHRSSGVRHKGTFEGLIEKISHLKDLGINAVELLPAYEFEECEWETRNDENKDSIEYQVEHYDEKPIAEIQEEKSVRLNYWGFKEAFYFSPKASYAASSNPCDEFKRMVQEFHKNGIEIIMQFYFPNNIKQGYILDILKHWVMEYHVDGFHLKGDSVPVTLIATEPLFATTKIMYHDFFLNEIYTDDKQPANKNLAYYRDEFMFDMRRFLKGDHDMLRNFQYHMRNYHTKCGVINYLANYYGFTLNDMVSYERKHNEANGENNTDGTDYNLTWNCGFEGATRKKSIIQLRKQQMKNALSFLLTAQGTPLIYAGDEFGNTQNGNNNCYCQDNETGWVDWGSLNKNSDIFVFVKALIAFRKQHGILHLDTGLNMLDRYGYGYPDLSYHGEEAWKANVANYNRHIAFMYCGHDKVTNEADYIYVAYNMHWNTHRFALPSIANYEWTVWVSTSDVPVNIENENSSSYIDIPERSVIFMTGKKSPKPEKKNKKTVKKSGKN